jgi:hypothetical protein
LQKEKEGEAMYMTRVIIRAMARMVTVGRLVIAVLFALLGTQLGGGVASGHAASAHATRPSPHLTLRARIDLKSLRPTAPHLDPSKNRANRARSPYQKHSRAASQVHAGQTSAAASLSTLSTVANFNGANSLTSRNLNGFDVEPPDQGLCASGSFELEAINLVVEAFTPTGTTARGPVSLNSFLGESPNENLNNPRCEFDRAGGAFFVSATAIDPSGGDSHLDLAVLNSSLTSAMIYSADTADIGASGCPCFVSQPSLGLDAFNVYLSGNEFSINGNAFDGAVLFAVNRSDLETGAFSPRSRAFPRLTIAGNLAFAVQPAFTVAPSSSTPEYFLSSIDPSGNGGSQLGVWALTGQANLNSAVLSKIVITSESFSPPPSATSTGGAVLDTGVDGMQQVENLNGNLWASLDTSIVPANDTAPRSGIAWFEVAPTVTSGTINSATVAQQNYLDVAGKYLLYGAIEAATNSNVAIDFGITSASLNPSAAYSTSTTSATSFPAPTIAATGADPDHGFTCNLCAWGGYSAASLTPAGANIWMATEYIPGLGDRFANWGTRIFEV